MNPIQELKQRIADRFPRASLALHAPVRADGIWSLDVERGEEDLTVEWQPSRGFGLSSLDDAAFGEGHDEVYPTLPKVWARLQALLSSGGRTQAPPNIQLRRLREMVQMSQVDLAGKLNVGQASISKLERRRDVLLSSLANMIAAMGGQLEITARFPKRTVKLITARRSSVSVPKKARRASARSLPGRRTSRVRARS
jgi:transcriptional regulator with XRE-family HTH domain